MSGDTGHTPGSAGHVLRVPTEVRHTERGRKRWCFACRKYRAGTYLWHVPSDEWSYYGPHWSYRCDGCGEDRRLGFGWEWLDGVAGPSMYDRAVSGEVER